MAVNPGTMMVNYTADIVFPSGEKFQITGAFPLAGGSDANTLTPATVATATAMVAADITAKIVTGVPPSLPPLTFRQSLARGRT